jgi:CheY-like chemotaxis protein
MAKILLVEDDKLLSKVYKTNFEVMGHQTDVALDGEQAWEKIKLGGYQVILMDLRLPKLSGLQLLSLMKNELPPAKKCPVVVLSNVDDDETIKEIMDLGAAGYLTKGKITPQSIVQEVEKYINPPADKTTI